MTIPPKEWFENEAGERWPGLEGDPTGNGYIYQKTRFPMSVQTNTVRFTPQSEVDACPHEEVSLRPAAGTYRWDWEQCLKCNGLRSREVGKEWGKWNRDLPGFQIVLSAPQNLVEKMVRDGMGVEDALMLSYVACAACKYDLGVEYGVEAGYSRDSESFRKWPCSCELCKA